MVIINTTIVVWDIIVPVEWLLEFEFPHVWVHIYFGNLFISGNLVIFSRYTGNWSMKSSNSVWILSKYFSVKRFFITFCKYAAKWRCFYWRRTGKGIILHLSVPIWAKIKESKMTKPPKNVDSKNRFLSVYERLPGLRQNVFSWKLALYILILIRASKCKLN